jgi:hypothetical protein
MQDDVDPSAPTRISIDLQQTMCLGRPSLPTVASLYVVKPSIHPLDKLPSISNSSFP